jgi:cysteine desulfurase
MKELYLDANAHVPMSEATLKVYADFHRSKAGWGHPSAPAKPGQEASTALENARAYIATLLGCNAEQLIFTSTCTQACEWGMQIVSKKIGNDYIYCSPMEHSAVSESIKICNVNSLQVTTDGVIDLDKVPYNVPICCTHVQNEIGAIQPITELKASYLFSDMCQSIGKESICLREMPVDIAVFGAHKFGGPAGVGILYLKDTDLWTEFGTGSRYFNDRPGTPDVAAVVATAAALEETLINMPERLMKMKEFQFTLECELENLGVEIISKNAKRVPNTTFVRIPKISLMILAELSQKGIYVGMGSACGSMHTGQSLTMKGLGLDGDGNDFLRISQHGSYGKQEALILVKEISKLIKRRS